MGGEQVQAFLTWLSVEHHVSASTRRQALSALLFLFQQVFGQQLPWMAEINRPQRKPRLPTVLTAAEVGKVLALLDGTHGVLARLLYGTGMRITEALQLRSKDVDFERQVIVVREGKGRRRNKSDVPAHIVPAVATSACWREIGGKDRVVMLPAALADTLKVQIRRAQVLWRADVAADRAGVQMPDAIDRKFPRAGLSFAWFWVFPQAELSTCPRTQSIELVHGGRWLSSLSTAGTSGARCSSRLLTASRTRTATGSVAMFCWYSKFLSIVRKSSNLVAAKANSLPFLIPDQPQRETVETSCPSGMPQVALGGPRQAGYASGNSANRASSNRATAASRVTDDKSSKNTSSESPASRWSNRDFTGTRVPANTGVPLWISGSTVMSLEFISFGS